MSQEKEERSPSSEPKKRKKYVYLDKFEQHKQEQNVLRWDLITQMNKVRRIAVIGVLFSIAALLIHVVHAITK